MLVAGAEEVLRDRGFSVGVRRSELPMTADPAVEKMSRRASGRPADPLKSQAQHAEDVLDRRAAGAADRTSGPCGGRYIPTFVCQHMFFWLH